MKGFICFIVGHKKSVKVQVSQGYKMYICGRCKTVFAERKEVEEQQAKKRIEKEQRKQQKIDAKLEKKRAKLEKKSKQLNGEDVEETEEP